MKKFLAITLLISVMSMQAGDKTHAIKEYIEKVAKLGYYRYAFSEDGTLMASGTDATKEGICKFNGKVFDGKGNVEYNHKGVNSVALNWKHVISGGSNKKVKIFDIKSEKIVSKYKHAESVFSVCISPDGEFVASLDKNNQVIIANIDGTEVESYKYDPASPAHEFDGGFCIASEDLDGFLKIGILQLIDEESTS